MALANDLMGVGFPAGQAVRVGLQVAEVTAAGTAQGTATALKPTQTAIVLTTAASETGVRLTTDYPLWTPIYIVNNTATTANVFPPSGAKINNGSDDAAVTITVNLARVFVRRSATRWMSWVTA